MERTLLSTLIFGAWKAAGQNTTLFEGVIRIGCVNGTCAFNEDCINLDSVPGTLVLGSAEIEYTDILGDFALEPSSCQAECSDCLAIPGSDQDEGGCTGSAGYVYCPETDQCLRPWESACPLEGSSFAGPVDINCTAGSRCSTVSDDCELSVGSYTIGGFYLTGLEGAYTIPDKCVLKCQGCVCEGCPPDGNNYGGNTTDPAQDSGTRRPTIRLVVGAILGYFLLVLL